MYRKNAVSKVLAAMLSLLTILITVPFTPAEVIGAAQLGVVITPAKVTVGNSTAPTGTTLFAGDRVSALESPALINFNSGSRVEMTKAAAAFSRDGDTLVVQASQGLLRFNFKNGEAVQINAGRFQFTAAGNGSAHAGELGLNRNGQVAMNLNEGVFAALDTSTGARFEVPSGTTFAATDQSGKGTIAKGGKTLTDSSKTWKESELKAQCVVAGGEAFAIVSNTATVATIKGTWKLADGAYDYKILECKKDALIAAGATAAAAAGAAAAGAAVAGAVAAGAAAGAAAGISGATVAIIAGVAAAAVGVGVGIQQATKTASAR